MEEVGAQVVSPMVIHQHLPARFCDSYQTAKKRALPSHSSSFLQQNASDNWNPKSWNWDSSRFVAKPLQYDGVQVESGEGRNSASYSLNPTPSTIDGQNLLLKLGNEGGRGSRGNNGGVNFVEPQLGSRPSKRVRSGSPGCANYPMCQVDNCNEDLSTAKDYHRRHKVCEFHSKAGKALVGKQMQRFCQQCSRFHPLSEFDEEKRSCRRRLAGHNRRRRKTQPEDTTPQVLVPDTPDTNITNNDIINLLAVLTRAQGNMVDNSGKFPSIPDKDQLIQILGKIDLLPEHLAAKLKNSNPDHVSSENPNQMNENASSTSTMDLLAGLSATPGAPPFDPCDSQSQYSTEGSDSEKRSTCVDQAAHLGRHMMEYQEMLPSPPLQLFTPSPGDYRTDKLQSDKNFLSSGSSYPSEERSPLSSPPVEHNLFPMQTSRETMKDDRLSSSEDEIAYVEAANGCSTSLQLFRATENVSMQSSPYRAGYTSSSGSDHSPSCQNSDAQDRTGRIIFKLFDKDPGHLPGSLRTQIFNWLSNSPSEMESFIRPGCVVLSLYLSMPSFAWNQLEQNILCYVKSLVNDIDVDFWANGRFLVHTDRQMASHKEGKIRLCKSWKPCYIPELYSISPVAIVGGQETSLVLTGRCMTTPGTRIHCTHSAGYNIREANRSSSQKTEDNKIILANFKVNGSQSGVLGRCFIEVENSFRVASFPVIIADSTICQELRLLEPEINGTAEMCDEIPADHVQETGWPRAREEVLHFLNELGWLFQRKYNSSLFEIPHYRLDRFKFLLIFSIERDFCALVKTLLDILLELNLGRQGLANESMQMLSEIHLLNRAVKRRCHRMVDLLIRYSIIDSIDTSAKFIFMPNMPGPGGITPLHLAACTSSADDIVDSLTSDPHEIGLQSWNSVLDANGLSPYSYAVMRNNHSYNTLIARKLGHKKNGQIIVPIEDGIKECQVKADKDIKTTFHIDQTCSRCATFAARGYSRNFPGSKGLLQRPYIHSMLLVAAVCACVCLFLRGHPYVGCVSPFAWDNLGYGTM